VLTRKASNANVIVFGLTRQESEPTIYRTRSEHANHYTAEIEPLLKLKERRYQLGNKKPYIEIKRRRDKQLNKANNKKLMIEQRKYTYKPGISSGVLEG
jgi:hypothetical protein